MSASKKVSFIPLLILLSKCMVAKAAEKLSIYPVIMPMVVPSKNEVYLCTSIDLSQTNDTFWIRGFEPKVSEGRVHHMAVAGSASRPPKAQFNIWNCGNNGKPANDPNYPNFGVFPNTQDGVDTTMYLWSKGGVSTMMPEGVAFKVGAKSKIKFLVLQVHYINVESIDKDGDASGVYLYYTREPQPKLAGVLSLHVDTFVPKLARSYQDVACRIMENKVLHPFSLMMHTHRHGKVVSAWHIRRNLAGRDQWSLLDKRDPLQGQHYYPILEQPLRTIHYGDSVAFRCTMVNLDLTDVKQGLASYDEMCDLYMMYYVDSSSESDLLEKANFCWSSGPPEVTWQSLGLRDIPTLAASTLP